MAVKNSIFFPGFRVGSWGFDLGELPGLLRWMVSPTGDGRDRPIEKRQRYALPFLSFHAGFQNP